MSITSMTAVAPGAGMPPAAGAAGTLGSDGVVSPQVTLTVRARAALALAEQEARGLNHNYVGTEHLLLGVLRGGGPGAIILARLGADLKQLRDAIAFVIGRGDRPTPETLRLTPRGERVLTLASAEACRLGHDAVDPEHVLLGLAREGEGIAAVVLGGLGIRLAAVRDHLDPTVTVAAPAEPGRPATLPTRGDRLTARAKRALVFAQEEARRLNHHEMDTAHVLLGLVREEEGLAARSLARLGVHPAAVRQAVECAVGCQAPPTPGACS